MTAVDALGTLWWLLVAVAGYNVALTGLAVGLALPVGGLLALGRLSRWRAVYWATTAYVNVLRGSPLLMVLFWTYCTAPMLGARNLSAFHAALVGLTAFEAAYFAELIRAGIQSVPREQATAGLATGLTPWQVSRLVTLPQAVAGCCPRS